MAQVVLGLGTSHSPILNMEPDAWIERGSHDHKHKLRDTSGALVSFDALLERHGTRSPGRSTSSASARATRPTRRP